MYSPRRELRDTLLSTITTDNPQAVEEQGQLILSFSTGQSLQIPLAVQIGTPFLVASSPRLTFGTCRVTMSCQGMLLLSNPTDVEAKWMVSHVPGGGAAIRRVSAIRVKGFDTGASEVDDPSVFTFSPNEGVVQGPTVSVASAMSAPPKDNERW